MTQFEEYLLILLYSHIIYVSLFCSETLGVGGFEKLKSDDIPTNVSGYGTQIKYHGFKPWDTNRIQHPWVTNWVSHVPCVNISKHAPCLDK